MKLKNILLLSVLFLGGCKKYLDNTQLPAGVIAGDDAFVSDNSTSAIVTGCFLSLNSSGPFSGGGGSNLAYLTALYMDETKTIAISNTTAVAFYNDFLTNSNTSWWIELYKKLYVVNGALEGIQKTPAMLYYKNQWLGESYFTRAFLYFHLVNCYGDVPLALTTDYKLNGSLSRSRQSEVYQQIISDLKQAQNLLGTDYRDGYGAITSYRVRPNRAVATALLAKAYLYAGQYDSAEVQANAIIGNTAYKLESPAQVFLTASNETIWALATKTDEKTYEYNLYNGGMPATLSTDPAKTYLVLVAMNSPLLNAFEPGDARYTSWVRSTIYTGVTPAITYYFPNKYKSATGGAEKTVMLRLAELYLIRAEARARQNKITGANSAETDLNTVRTRAGLLPTTATTQADMLAAIAKERQVELFTEGSNRFFDLKRTGAIDAVMNIVAPLKGSSWSTYKQLFPIPPDDIILNPNLAPNPGY